MAHANWPDFFTLVGKLKSLPRQGWVDRGVPSPESVAEHTFRTALMAWTLGGPAGLDCTRLLKLSLVHDLPEAVAGDATPYAQLITGGLGVADAAAHWRDLLAHDDLVAAKREKHQLERAALSEIVRDLELPLAAEITDLWEDYAERRTPEARFVAQVDKLEALLQALEYREAGHPSDVESFLKTARDEVEHPVLRELLEGFSARIED